MTNERYSQALILFTGCYDPHQWRLLPKSPLLETRCASPMRVTSMPPPPPVDALVSIGVDVGEVVGRSEG